MYLCLICGSLLYDPVVLPTEFKVGRCNYVGLRSNPYRGSNRGNSGGTLTSNPVGYVTMNLGDTDKIQDDNP